MSMGASLEVRVPFADHRLVEYAWNIPWEYKMVGNQEKGILRKAFKECFPKTFFNAKKALIQKHIILFIQKKYKYVKRTITR